VHARSARTGVLGVALLALACASPVPASRAGPQRTSRFDAARAYEHVRQLVAIGPRPAGSPASEQARRYIMRQLRSMGLTPREQTFQARTPVGAIPMTNVAVTLPGTSPARIVIGGHYDTKRVRGFRFVGANDGGSSTAMLIELARVLAARSRAFTIDLVFFDGEEAVIEWVGTDHTYGSRHYVAEAQRDGTIRSLRAMLLVDMVGDRELRIRRESASTPWLSDAIWASARRLGFGHVFLEEEMAVEDDHRPFLDAGVPAVNVIDFEFPQWHTAGDTLDAVSARSLQVVGDVLLDALPAIEARLGR
jgi:Zn-dependent M28 family amino/carboxypeptidase